MLVAVTFALPNHITEIIHKQAGPWFAEPWLRFSGTSAMKMLLNLADRGGAQILLILGVVGEWCCADSKTLPSLSLG